MTYVYVFAPIVLIIVLYQWIKRSSRKDELKKWLLEINQWEVGDVVELSGWKSSYPLTYKSNYFCIQHNKHYSQQGFYDAARTRYTTRFPALEQEAFVKLVKWDSDDALVEFADGEELYISTKFIIKNIDHIRRKIEKKTDNFILTKKDRIQKLRQDKLIRVLKDNE